MYIYMYIYMIIYGNYFLFSKFNFLLKKKKCKNNSFDYYLCLLIITIFLYQTEIKLKN